MATDPIQEETITRLRVLATHAGVTLDAGDLARITAGAYLRNADALALLLERIPPDTIPDALKDWSPLSAAAQVRNDEWEAAR